MKKWTLHDFYLPVLFGAVPAVVLFIFRGNVPIFIRLIDSLFLGGLIPFTVGSWRLVCNVGSFDLFVYTNGKIWGGFGKKNRTTITDEDKKASERYAGSYHDYVMRKKPGKPYGAYMLTGSVVLTVSVILSCITFL